MTPQSGPGQQQQHASFTAPPCIVYEATVKPWAPFNPKYNFCEKFYLDFAQNNILKM